MTFTTTLYNEQAPIRYKNKITNKMIGSENSVMQTDLCQTEPKESHTIDLGFYSSNLYESEFKNFLSLNMDLNSLDTC